MQRLKNRPQFQAVLAGQTVARTPHFAMHRCPIEPAVADVRASGRLFAEAGPWLGAMVPKRWARRAVTRNALKRQIYQVAAHYAQNLPEAAHVVRLRVSFDRKQYPSACSDSLKAAARAELEQLFVRAMRT